MRQVYRINWENDYSFLKKKLCDNFGPFHLEEADLDILRCGEETFLWESPLAESLEEAEDMVRRAAVELTPRPGRVILAAALYIITDSDDCLNAIWDINASLLELLPEDINRILGYGLCSEKGIRILLVTSVGRKGET